MESTNKRTEDFLHCKLCNNTFRDPRFLPCLHTYCKGCINKHVKNPMPPNGKHHVCPQCYRDVGLISNGNEDPAEVLPKNVLMEDLLDAFQLKNADDVKCKPCSRKRKSTLATMWCRSCKECLCDECLNFHQTLKQTMKHPVLAIADFQSKDLDEIIAIPTCQNHGEELTLYCDDHQEVICTFCAATDHRTCRSVQTVDKAAQRQRQDVKDLQRTLQEQEKGATSVYEDRQDVRGRMNEKMQKLVGEIKAVRQNLDKKLEKCESDLLRELEHINSQENVKIEGHVQEAESLLKATSNANDILSHAVVAGDAHLLKWVEKVNKEADGYASGLRSVSRNKVEAPPMNFEVNYQLDNAMRTVRDLGEIVRNQQSHHLLPKQFQKTFEKPTDPRPTQENRLPSLSSIHGYDIRDDYRRRSSSLPRSLTSNLSDITDLNSSPKPKSRTLCPVYTGRSPSDAIPCWFTGIAVLPFGGTVFVDKNNKKIKMCDDDFNIISEHLLRSEPFDVTDMNLMSTIAVTVPDEKKIELFSTSHAIKPTKTIVMTEKVYGISYTPGKFAVSCLFSKPPFVKVISEDGAELIDIRPNNGYQPLFMKPTYLTWDKNGINLYISDSKRNQIICMSGSRMKMFAYNESSLSSPRGLTLGENDSFYACGWATDNIHLVDRTGKFKTECLNRHDGVIGPQTICFDQQRRRLIVTLDTTSCNSDSIFVFNI